ncbi:auxilin-like protein, partial [Trifolium medium]|nr:auxilin-like protein [Trifolium medium]
VDPASCAFVASRAQSCVLQDHILRDSRVCGMTSDFDIALDGLRDMIPTFDFSNFTSKDTVPVKIQHVLASAVHAQDFLIAIPIEGLGQYMSPIEYRTILKYRLMIPIFPVDERAGISVKKKASVNFLTDPLEGKSTLSSDIKWFQPLSIAVAGIEP